MEEIQNNFNKMEQGDKLDHVLEEIETFKDKELEPAESIDSKKKIEPKTKWHFKDVAWYFEVFKKEAAIMFGLEAATYILAIFEGLNFILKEIIGPLLMIVYLGIFIFIVWKVKRKRNESTHDALAAVFMAGFVFGLLMAIFKLFWIFEYWTILNFIIEPAYMGLLAVAVGLIANLVIRRKKLMD
jgi:hypothetical protein